ncbi:MAG: putative glutamine amidotransferase [Rickettsiaceae bacterium]|jgi:putative glutamine amidotransferase|nr:putative glutamine amidotransferase [Rickettsiaceae bacterium]
MRKPVIGITLDLQNNSPKYSYSGYPWYALRQNYSASVKQLGGLPFMLPLEIDLIEETLDLLDGIIITGGDFDIHPKHYGQEIKSAKVITIESRTDYEFELFTRARKRGMPIFGICNGMQVINVVCGGSLIQDIPEERPSNINHEQPFPKDVPTHPLKVFEGTKLFEIVGGKTDWAVNTTHHQAIDKVGKGLIVSAVAPDGIIEAIESTEDNFVIGVEWHPEYLACGEIDSKLFAALIDEAYKYQKKK